MSAEDSFSELSLHIFHSTMASVNVQIAAWKVLVLHPIDKEMTQTHHTDQQANERSERDRWGECEAY
jgi:hypothetical protein